MLLLKRWPEGQASDPEHIQMPAGLEAPLLTLSVRLTPAGRCHLPSFSFFLRGPPHTRSALHSSWQAHVRQLFFFPVFTMAPPAHPRGRRPPSLRSALGAAGRLSPGWEPLRRAGAASLRRHPRTAPGRPASGGQGFSDLGFPQTVTPGERVLTDHHPQGSTQTADCNTAQPYCDRGLFCGPGASGSWCGTL